MVVRRSGMFTRVAVCALLAAVCVAQMGGYTPASNVVAHSRVALDICELETLVAADDYTQAKNVFDNGLRAENSDGTLRTLVAMAEKQSDSPIWQQVWYILSDC